MLWQCDGTRVAVAWTRLLSWADDKSRCLAESVYITLAKARYISSQDRF